MAGSGWQMRMDREQHLLLALQEQFGPCSEARAGSEEREVQGAEENLAYSGTRLFHARAISRIIAGYTTQYRNGLMSAM